MTMRQAGGVGLPVCARAKRASSLVLRVTLAVAAVRQSGLARWPRRILSVASLLLPCLAAAQSLPVAPVHAPVTLVSPVQDKNFYLLSAIERTPEAREAVQHAAALSRIAGARNAALDKAARDCAQDVDCYVKSFRWAEDDSAEAGHALSGLYDSSPAIRNFVDGPLRRSGMYVRYNGDPGGRFLERAWADCVAGMNRMMDVYGAGKAPRYPEIDAPTYDPASTPWKHDVQILASVVEDGRESLTLFFSPSLRFALELMLMNQRDEAGRHEPLEAKENEAAFRQIAAVDWNRFPYSAIVVPGAGNDRPGVRLSPGGRLRDEIAAKRYREGKAPLVIVSGGYVHPVRTEYSEAIEMKRDLITRFAIPAEAIIVDPHARHTTTNMRNAARLMYRYGIPFDKKALVSTDPQQSAYIENPQFEKRCLDELGYLPYRLARRTSPFDLEFIPRIESLHADPMDPLDP
jgi:DUF218 domain